MGFRFPAEQLSLFREAQAYKGDYKDQRAEISPFNEVEKNLMQPWETGVAVFMIWKPNIKKPRCKYYIIESIFKKGSFDETS